MIELKVIATIIIAWVTWLSWCINNKDFLNKEWIDIFLWNWILFIVIFSAIWC